MSWMVIYTKPAQELRVKRNLETLGATVYLPRRPKEKIAGGSFSVGSEPLFPRYIFLRNEPMLIRNIGHTLRYVRGISRVLKVGEIFSELDDETVSDVQAVENALLAYPVKAYQPGDKVTFTHGAFQTIEAIFKEPDGVARVILLFELLSKPTEISVPIGAVKKASC